MFDLRFLKNVFLSFEFPVRFCATSSISENTCIALQRGESQVSCVRVEDSSECAIRINRGEADFGVFTAEEALLAYQFYPADTRVIAQLKNKERTTGSQRIDALLLFVDLPIDTIFLFLLLPRNHRTLRIQDRRRC